MFGWLKEFYASTAEPSSTVGVAEPSSTVGVDIRVLHIIGGGSLNKYLNQFTADALDIEVLAGPQECTAIGNIMLQAKAAGLVDDVWQMRRLIADSVDMISYSPQGDAAAWAAAYDRYLQITERKH